MTSEISENPDVQLLIKTNDLGEQYAPTGNFRLQNQKLFLTYKSHLPKKEARDYFTNLTRGFKTFEIAHETGESNANTPYLHTHILIDFGRQFETRNARFFDINGIHPHIRKIKTAKHWDNCLNYLAKEDPANSHLKRDPSIVNLIWNCKDVQEALVQCVDRPSDALGISAIWEMKKRPPVIRPEPLWTPWQIEVDTWFESAPDPYIIHWIFDPVGRNGKTTYCQWKKYSCPEKFRIIANCGSERDMATVMGGILDSGWDHHALLVNIARVKVDHKSIYGSLESMKDGEMTALKYRGGCLEWNRPHIVVFANFLPIVNGLSRERWALHYIKNEQLFDMTIDDCIDVCSTAEYKDMMKLDNDFTAQTVLTVL